MPPEPLTILVDENVPFAHEAFGRLGAVRVRPGRQIAAADVADVDVLIVRSVTRVDEALLRDSPVRFVGTATIGCDHVDLPYLAKRSIPFASAPGSNANSVAEYVTAALLQSARARGVALQGATIAIVGVGNVGSRVALKAEALGMRCLLNDPPRQREARDPVFVPLRDAIAQADYVTLHVPLERQGPDATVGMANGRFFDALRPGAVFINTSRGAVVQEPSLSAALDAGRVAHAILDVWQGEPAIDPEMLRRAFIGTPHIAGYSYDGKVVATLMLYSALCDRLGVPDVVRVDLSGALPPAEVPLVDLRERDGSDEDLLRAAVSAVYDIMADDRALREATAGPLAAAGPHAAIGPNGAVGPNFSSAVTDRAAGFDLLRKRYRRRREFPHTAVVVPRRRDALAAKAARLGFRVETH
jgi:erythronate-4-phosphate dehydrogenase